MHLYTNLTLNGRDNFAHQHTVARQALDCYCPLKKLREGNVLVECVCQTVCLRGRGVGWPHHTGSQPSLSVQVPGPRTRSNLNFTVPGILNLFAFHRIVTISRDKPLLVLKKKIYVQLPVVKNPATVPL